MAADVPMTVRDMSQISPPLRILLIGSVVFLAAWFAFMRPGGSTGGTTKPSTPAQPLASNPNGPKAQTGLGRAVQSAHGAAQATEAASAAAGADPAAATAPSTTGTAPAPAAAGTVKAKTADAAAGLPVPVAKALAEKKILVMLFWNPKAADDRAVRKALRHVDNYRHRVVIKVANIN